MTDYVKCPQCGTWQHPFVICPKCEARNPTVPRSRTRRVNHPGPQASPNYRKWREEQRARLDERDGRILSMVHGLADGDGRIPMTARELTQKVSASEGRRVDSSVVRGILRADGWTYNAQCKWWTR